jgi:hypothetical protein
VQFLLQINPGQELLHTWQVYTAPFRRVGLGSSVGCSALALENITFQPRAPAHFVINFDSPFGLEVSMSIHKFRIGQIVEVLPAVSRNIPGGFLSNYQAIAGKQRRVRVSDQGHERAARTS